MREAILIFSFGILSFLSLCFGGGAKASMCLWHLGIVYRGGYYYY
jgi:hypothetical protein